MSSTKPSPNLCTFVEDFAKGLRAADARRPISRTPRHTFKPGIGPFPEAEAVALALREMIERRPGRYDGAAPSRYPGTRTMCDLLIAELAAIEFKLVRPFGDNGKEAEHWSQNLLHPYPGNVSLLADCLKLCTSTFEGERWVIAFGYEHTPPRIPLEPVIRSFEVVAEHVMSIRLSDRSQVTVQGLIHPSHQQAVVVGWQVLGSPPPAK